MLRSIAIFALLCCIAHLGTGQSLNEEIFSRVIETRLPNPISVVLDSTIYTISKTNKTLSVNSSDATCKLAVDPFDENIQGRIRAVTLPVARKIVVWGIQSSSLQGAVRITYYTLLIVDPLSCGYKMLQLPEDKLPTSWPSQLLPQLVAYDKEFYIFYPTHQKCAPCHFNSAGSKQSTVGRQLQQQTGVPHKQFFITSYFSNKYKYMLHAYNFDNGTAMIELVDDYYFESATRLYVDHSVDAASVAYGTYQNTAICYVSSGNRQQVTCERLNTRLLPGLSWQLPLSEPASDVSIEVDSLGNTFIGVLSSLELRFFIYNVDGQLVADVLFGEIDKNYTNREVKGLRIGDEFCLDAVAYFDRDAQDARHLVKCVHLENYVQATVFL